MIAQSLTELLAQAPSSTMYIHPAKLIGALICCMLWALYAQWADKDAVAVNTYRVVWNIVHLCTGVVAIACLFFIPIFWAGLAGFAVVFGADLIAYVVHRNGLVEEDYKVGTPAHFQRLISQGLGSKRREKLAEVRERVKLTAHDRSRISIPTELEEREQYRVTQDLLFDALWRRAGVIEMAPAGEATRVVYSIDGIVTEREALPRAEGEAVMLYLKRLAGLSLEERRKPQMGKLGGAVGENKYELAVRTAGSNAGEKLQLRVIGAEKFFKVGDLGLTESQLEQVREMMHADKGVVIVSAPARSGLTTTMYSLARSHDAFLQNIQMLEYSRELEIENITQRHFEPGEDRTFTLDLQKIMRADPNVVFVPDLREPKSAGIAANAGATKQKVYVGYQAVDPWDALNKWLTLVGDPKIVAKGLIGALHQRLVRKLCEACKAAYKPDPAMLRKLNVSGEKVLFKPPDPQFDKNGNPIICQACQGSGYVGRTAVFHVLPVDDGLRAVIRDGGSLSDIQQYCLKQGGGGLQQQAIQKVFEGVTSVEEVVRATKTPGAPARPAAAAS